MRARGIKPGFFTDEAVVDLSPWARLLFIGLWCVADRAGRLMDKPKQLKIQLFPCDNVDVEAMLQEIAAGGLILRYSAQGESFIQVVNFSKHQSPHVKEVESTIPAPDWHGASTRPAPEIAPRNDASVGGTILTPDCGLLTADSGLLTPELSEGAPASGDTIEDDSGGSQGFQDVDFEEAGEPPPEPVEPQEDKRTPAQQLVAYYAEACDIPGKSKPTKTQVGILASIVGEKLPKGAKPEHIREAIKRLVTSGKPVTNLPALIDQVEAEKVSTKPRDTFKPPEPPMTKEERAASIAAARETAAQVAALGRRQPTKEPESIAAVMARGGL